MRRIFQLLLLLAASGCATTAPPDLQAEGSSWQSTLDQEQFQFNEENSNAFYSLSQCNGNFKIHMIYDPSIRPLLTIRFERDGKEVISITGFTHSVFGTIGDVLYFAHFSPIGSGCAVSAHDLTTGKTLWKTTLDALPPIEHSAYSNRVNMSLLAGPDKQARGYVQISGREEGGDYAEVLDAQTGAKLAHRIYRQRYGVQ